MKEINQMPGKQTSGKFTNLEREQVLAAVARMHRHGYTHQQIAEKCGIGLSTVNHYVRQIKDRYLRMQMGERHQNVMEKIAELRDIRVEAWEAWEASKGEVTSDLAHRVFDELMTLIEDCQKANKIITRDMLASIQVVSDKRLLLDCLQVIMSCIKAERELLGLDQPKKIDVKSHAVDWNRLMDQVQGRDKNQVEALLNDALNNPDKTMLIDGTIIGQEPIEMGTGTISAPVEEVSRADEDDQFDLTGSL